MNEPGKARDAAIDPGALAQAADWLVRLQEGPLAPAQRAEFERWRQHSSENERAWKRALRLLERIENLPPSLARRTLARPDACARRTVMRTLLVLIGAAPLGLLSWRAFERRKAMDADYLTALGERHDATLEDGTQVLLNTDTALTVHFSSDLRLLHLRRGEIYLRSGTDSHVPPRPLLVQSEQGLMRALGTTFNVRQFDGETLLAVYEGAVQARPGGTGDIAGAGIVNAGQQVRFRSDRIGLRERITRAAPAWLDGLLLADEMPVQQWVQELMRYDHGIIVVDPSLDGLLVSGTFPVNDLKLALTMLAQTHGVRVRMTGRGMAISR